MQGVGKVVIVLLLGYSTFSLATTLDIGGGTRIFVPLKSVKALRDENVVKQQYDYSCGAGALATLLTYGLNDKVTEREILEQLMETLSKDQAALRKKTGFSLLDMQHIAEQRGYKAQGFRLRPEHLPKLKRPVVVFICPRGYEHFSVFKGVHADRIYLADPSLGNVRMPAYKFLDMWLDDTGQGVVFVVERKDSQWPEGYPLQLKIHGLPQPEILTARQLLEVGNPYVQFPQLQVIQSDVIQK